MNTTLLKLAAEKREIVNSIIAKKKASFQAVAWQSEKTGSRDHKGKLLVKECRAVVRAGIDFANLGTVKSGIENGERGEVESLKWGEWIQFPYLIQHKGEIYVRLYPTDHVRTRYLVDGKEVEKSVFDSYLPPSSRSSGDAPACITVKANNLMQV